MKDAIWTGFRERVHDGYQPDGCGRRDRGLLNEYNIDARLLQVEITESAVAKNLPVVKDTIRKLHARGIVVLMDDFGSAYSSLNMLKDINVDVIKLDTKFIELSDENAGKGMKIIQSMIVMAKKLHLMIIAEGAQTKEQVDWLKANWMRIHPRILFLPSTAGETDGNAVGRACRRSALLGYVVRLPASRSCDR